MIEKAGELNYQFAQNAARRSGVKFRLQLKLSQKSRLPHRRVHKANTDSVRAMRQWCAREGFGLAMMVQCRMLQQQYPTMKVETINDIVSNRSWYDPHFVPGVPDREFWKGQSAPLTAVMLRVLSRRDGRCRS